MQASELLRDALPRLENLIEHARFTALSGLDREFYPENCFNSWITLMFRGPLSDNQVNTFALRKKETEFTIATSDLLSSRDAYHFARFPTANIINQHSMGYDRTDLIPHLEAVKAHLQSRLYSKFIECIRNGRVTEQFFLSELGVSVLAEVFGDLESWNPYSDGLSALHTLENEIPRNQQIAASMATIASGLLSAAEYIARTGDGQRVAFTRLTIHNHPDYIALVWRMATQCKEQLDDLLVQKARARRSTRNDTAITTDQFDLAFSAANQGA